MEPLSLKQVTEDFLFSLKADGRAQRTYDYYLKPLKLLLRFSVEQQWPSYIQNINATYIRNFITWAASRTGMYFAGNGSKRYFEPRQSRGLLYYKATRHLFTWAFEQHITIENPFLTIHFKTPPAPQIQPYAVSEIQAMALRLDSPDGGFNQFLRLRNKAILLLYIDSAMRLAEMGNLNLFDLNIAEGYVLVLGKGNKNDYCPFSPTTACVLKTYCDARETRTKTDKLWIKEDGTPLTVEGIRAWFRKLKHSVKISSPGGVHRLRHTAALSYLRATRDPFLLQLFLRHTDLAMSRRYVQGLKKEEAILAHHNGGSPIENLGIK